MSETRDTCFRCGGKGVIEATPMACGVRCLDECPVCGDKAEIDRLTARIEELENVLWQLLDDMGDDGLSVCQAAKDQARSTLEASDRNGGQS